MRIVLRTYGKRGTLNEVGSRGVNLDHIPYTSTFIKQSHVASNNHAKLGMFVVHEGRRDKDHDHQQDEKSDVESTLDEGAAKVANI